MPVPTDVNSQIALKRGWKWIVASTTNPVRHFTDGFTWTFSHWIDTDGEPHSQAFDYVGTLEGVSLLMRELGEWADSRNYSWKWDYHSRWPNVCVPTCYCISLWEMYDYGWRRSIWGDNGNIFISAPDEPGHCIGRAWLSIS